MYTILHACELAGFLVRKRFFLATRYVIAVAKIKENQYPQLYAYLPLYREIFDLSMYHN